MASASKTARVREMLNHPKHHPSDRDRVSEELRERTGSVNDGRPLVVFLYMLLRDHVLPGDIEKMMRGLSDAEARGIHAFEFTNGHLARYAQDLADRLEGE